MLVFLSSSYSTTDTLTDVFLSLITFFSLPYTYVTKTHTYLPNLAQFGYGFTTGYGPYYSTALAIFLLWFSFGNPLWISTAMLIAGIESMATARHLGFTVQIDSTHTSCAWETSDSQCRSPSTGLMAHVLSTILVRNKNITGIADSVQAQLGCPSSAQLELDMQGTIVWLYTAPDSPLKSN